MTFKINISQFYDLSELKQWKWNKTRYFSMRYIQIWRHIYIYIYDVRLKVFQWLSKLTFLSFMTKVNPNSGNETKPDIFPLDIFKSDILYHRLENTQIFQWFGSFNFIGKMSRNKLPANTSRPANSNGTCAN